MELSQFSDFALRTLIYVGLRDTAERTSVREIAEAYQISRNHLVKVVHHLAKIGVVETTRGRGGGIQLAHDPAEINIGKVLRKTEIFGLVECMPPREGTCCIAPVCVLKTALAKAKTAFLNELDRYTLADLIRPRSKLQQLLAHPPAGASAQ
jgi:Rrf2 family nitric oxide-sensitive transcriptional repressor